MSDGVLPDIGHKYRSFVSLSQEKGIDTAVHEGYRYARGSIPGMATVYWDAAPHWYRRQVANEVGSYEAPVSVFKRVFVDPDAIRTFTGRSYDLPAERWQQFGSVEDGPWDRRGQRSIADDRSGPPSHPNLFFADQFGSTVLHRALANHFVEGVPWEDTAFVERAMEIVDSGGCVWQGCRTRKEVAAQGDRVDRLYHSIDQQGYQSMVSMARNGEVLRSFPEAIANEIVVDIARDGALLFANGRHRLSIAKILDLDRIPVAILVRHADWVRYRDAVYRSGTVSAAHPDLVEFDTG